MESISEGDYKVHDVVAKLEQSSALEGGQIAPTEEKD
jgi:hypothetical protein